MVSTPLRSKILSHTRSASLPCRSHPLIPQFNDHLHKLEPSNSNSLPSITNKLSCLEDMYNCVDDLMLLPHTHQVFAHERQEKWVDETLDGYLTLVDACATAKDFVFHAKQDMQDLLSALRRRREADDFCGFLNSRRNAKKTIQKSLRNINSFKNKPTVVALDKDQETIAVVSMLKEAESVTLDLIEALLSSLAGVNKAQSRLSGWTLVSRLMQTRRFSAAGQDSLEFEELDAALCKLVKCDSSLQIEDFQNLLKQMESSIQAVEERLESLFKRLIKTRVSLLNMQSLQYMKC